MTRDQAKSRDNFVGFLITMNFLRCCEVDGVRNARFGVHLDEMHSQIWKFIDSVCELKEHKVQCPAEWPVKLCASCDGTHMPTQEPRDENLRRNPKNHSHKHNFAGLNYLIVLALWENEVLCTSAGDPASKHDMTAIHEEFMDKVPDGGRVVADAGFSGKSEREKRTFTVNNNLDSDDVRKFKGRAKARQEMFNERMKAGNCLTVKFRHGVDKHKKCFLAVLILCQCAIEDASVVGDPLDTL